MFTFGYTDKHNRLFHGMRANLFVQDVYRTLPAVVARILNGANVATPAADVETTQSGAAANSSSVESVTPVHSEHRRRRATDGGRYSESGIGLVEVNPAIKDDKLRVALYAEDRGMA